MEEYNSQAAALHTSDPREKIVLLNAFVAKYPDSPLLIYTYPQYCEAYQKLQDFSKVIEFAEKVLYSSDTLKLDVNTRLESAVAWAWAYNNLRSNDTALAAKGREVTRMGLELLDAMKEENVLRRNFKEESRKAKLYLNVTAAAAALVMKDEQAASASLSEVAGLSAFDPSALRPIGQPFK
jgi:hypothetical protein